MDERRARPGARIAESTLVRQARPEDAEAIAAIYNEGIADRTATFETRPRTPKQVAAWLGDPRHPIVVAERDGRVVAWASASAYRPRACYDGVAEFSVYAARDARATGAGRAALTGLIDAAERSGIWKLVSRIFPENEASRGLCRSLGFREVGTYRRHGKLDGVWRDTVIVELLLGEAREDSPVGPERDDRRATQLAPRIRHPRQDPARRGSHVQAATSPRAAPHR